MRRKVHRVAILAIVLSFVQISAASSAEKPETLRVMTFNIWVGGEAGKLPLDQTIKVVQAAKADLVGIQESHGEKRGGKKHDAAQAIAQKLSWHYFNQGDEDRGIISRYKIVDRTPKKWGAAIEMPSGRRVWVFNSHFAHSPYQPYQLLRIPYDDGRFIRSADDAISEARKAREAEVKAMLDEIKQLREQETIFVVGDFNEPSGLDWTDATFRAGKCPVAVDWPTAGLIYDAGFLDAYRNKYPDPIKWPGITWTSTTAEDDPKDRHDRIDFVMLRGFDARIVKTQIVGERPDRADIVVTPYPSDHRAVVATIRLE
jgi:endonuclease/exonuclease/phosphatase family metal-dependent hydrolase